jgi:hypothetical protein
MVEFGEGAGIQKDGQRELTPGIPLRPNIIGEIARYL